MSWNTLWRPAPATDGSAREERRHRWRHFFRLTASYFVSNDWKAAWAMLLPLIALQFVQVYGMYLVSYWEKDLIDALTARRGSAFAPLLIQFLGIALLVIVQTQVRDVLQPLLTMRWRRWLTTDYTERWLRHDRFHDIERSRLIDNPDQRIAEDLSLFTAQLLPLVMNLIYMLASAWTLGAILYGMSDPIRMSLGGRDLSIPGDMVIYGILYAVVGTLIITQLGRPFVRATMEQQHREANFRFRLINVRRHAEQIAFARATANEWRKLNTSFARVFHNLTRVVWTGQIIGVGGGVYAQLGSVLPVLIAVPKYFAGQLTLGSIMQSRAAFNNFLGVVSFFVQAYSGVAVLVAIITRIRLLDEAIAAPVASGIAIAHDGDAGVSVRRLALTLPDGVPLARIDHWAVASGERWTVRGPSGSGKSTLLRAVAGLWPYGGGVVSLPATGRTMFLPQRAYLPIGTLKEAMCFPADPDAFGDDVCLATLDVFRLAALGPRLADEDVWGDTLSPGEQQRLALSRVLLHRPEYLFLDEATSALDADNAAHAYQALLAALPGLTLVSVVHDPALEQYHGRRLEIVDGVARCDAISDPSGPDIHPNSSEDTP